MAKKPTKQKFTTYSNLTKDLGKSHRSLKKEAKARAHAEYLATLPKNPFLRFLSHFHPKRVFKYWFSMRGLKMIGKIILISILLLTLTAGALFMYFRKELDSLKPEELMKRVATTVTKYYDRNGELLWEDTGTGEYRLVITSENINQEMKDATVAIEDKDFYKHSGVSFTGMMRAVIKNVQGSGNVQGGSTLTQQLIKQVYFADEANNRGLSGIPRKIKEVILSVEAERIYTKDQILTMYLNESPYGGRRNGVESAAQTYFGHSAKELTLAEAALLAAIPQSPGLYNPYNTDGNAKLIARQQTVLNYMREQFPEKYSQEEIDAAKKEAILDSIKPAEDQLKTAKAPHFIQMVKQDLEKKLGTKVVGQGGLTIKTTLDIRVQNIIDAEVEKVFAGSLPRTMGFDNASVTMLDNQTGQVLGLRGSRDFNYPDYGAVNSATSFIQPGSTIKPLVYSALINNQSGSNGTFGAGSIISDSPIPQSIYRTGDGNSVRNADGKFKGNIAIRQSLGESRNVPAIKAMALNGVDDTKETIRAMGAKSYCTDGVDQYAGLASAIGSCGTKQIEHANAFATIARMGAYKEVSDVLEVKNSQGQLLYEWKDESEQVIDQQTAYIISDILTDENARKGTMGARPTGMYIPGIKTATKTGTSDIGGLKKDMWMMSYTPKATLSVWYGNHIPKALRSGVSLNIGPLVAAITKQTYNGIFKSEGSWKTNDWFTKPSGIQSLKINGKTDIYPSWYNKNQKKTTVEKKIFDKVSKKLATDCTPAGAREELEVIKNIDPITKVVTYTPPDGYDTEHTDDFHSCGDSVPFVSAIAQPVALGNDRYSISAIVRSGKNSVASVSISINGNTYEAKQDTAGSWYIVVEGLTGSYDVSVTATDSGYYTGSGSQNVTFPNVTTP